MIVVDLPPFAPEVTDPQSRNRPSRTETKSLIPRSISLLRSSSTSSPASPPIVTASGRRSAPRVLVSQSQLSNRRLVESAVELPVADPRSIEYEVPQPAPLPSFGRASQDKSRDLGRLYEAVAGARRIAVICGAGVSVSAPANIPDFRSATGLFKKLKERYPTAGLTSGKDLFDARLFNSDKTAALFHTMIAELKTMANDAEPTAFHHFLKRLDSEGRLLRVYTQNIDGLEEKAGLTFGLGGTGDRTSTARALGKRKRNPGQQRAKWSRNQSDSALLLGVEKDEAQADDDDTPLPPMFPRVIPLHGALSTLTCAICSFKLLLPTSNALQPVPLSLSVSQTIIEEDSQLGSADIKLCADDDDDVPTTPQRAMELLHAGEPVPCPNCFEANRVRIVAGMRSRGIGRMKVDVVLYGGANEGAERVGQCLERDMLGLRDPHETPVPESAAETRARKRKEDKAKQVEVDSTSTGHSTSELRLADGQAEDVLGALFEEQDDLAPPATAPETSRVQSTTHQAARPRAPRLKPLPPDLLIVAGTSLKVPGTKRIVREFAKATRARDFRVYPSDDESELGSNDGRRMASKSRSVSVSDQIQDGAADDDEDDPSIPIRTVLLNFDFPVPSREWDDVFDIWIRGDLQRTACGLWPVGASPIEYTGSPGPFEAGTLMMDSWAPHRIALDEARMLEKKIKRKTGQSAINISSVSTEFGSKSTSSASLNATASASRRKSASATKRKTVASGTSVTSAAAAMGKGKDKAIMEMVQKSYKLSNGKSASAQAKPNKSTGVSGKSRADSTTNKTDSSHSSKFSMEPSQGAKQHKRQISLTGAAGAFSSVKAGSSQASMRMKGDKQKDT